MFGVGLCHIFAFGFILLHCTRYKLLFPRVSVKRGVGVGVGVHCSFVSFSVLCFG